MAATTWTARRPRSARCLRSPDAVGGQIEVLLDGGIRRGSDVVKALALGARAVMIGRAYLWGLAADGQAGVENVLDILRNGVDSALLGLGRSSVHELTPDDVSSRRASPAASAAAPAGAPIGMTSPVVPRIASKTAHWPMTITRTESGNGPGDGAAPAGC